MRVFLILFLPLAILFYLAFGFVMWELDLSQWPGVVRAMLVFLLALSALILAANIDRMEPTP